MNSISKIVLMLLFSQLSQARITVESSHELCQYQRTGEKVFTSGKITLTDSPTNTIIDVDRVIADMQTEIRKAVIEFEISGDPLTKLHRQICTAVYDDSKGANAGAYGSEYIFFGARLLSQMSKDPTITYYDFFYPVFYHELAHIIQHMRKETSYRFPLKLIETKRKELQADCLAGAMMQMHKEVDFNKYLASMKLMTKLGDHHIVGDHGIASQRQAAYSIGVFGIKQSLLRKSQVTTDYLFNTCSQKIIDELIF